MNDIEITLTTRLLYMNRIKISFNKLYPDNPKKLHRGKTQRAILKDCGLSYTGFNQRLVNEVLQSLSFRLVFIDGVRYFKI